MRRVGFILAVIWAPATALAQQQQTMPQMDFRNPLTLDQVGWMVVILVVLYVLLAGWGLPQIGKVLAHRDAVIVNDLEAARAAKAQADATVEALNRTMQEARVTAQVEIAEAVTLAKSRARENAAALQAKLDTQLEQSEAQIAAAREAALRAIKPVAEDTAFTMLAKLTGRTPDRAALAPEIDTAYAARATAPQVA